ncbi:MAG TPA: hypothetical protein VE596_09210 [Gaiellaceae bacterium]|nr:hypothetical protein [Gaiellaceae bacterium]
MTEHEDVLEQLYGILDDWKRRQFGEEQGEVLERLRVLSGTAPATSEELQNVTEALREVAAAIATRQERTPSPELTKIADLLEQVAGRTATTQAKSDIHDNFRRLAARMRATHDPGNNPLPVPPAASLDEAGPIEPTMLFPDGDASIYGSDLDAVAEIRVGGSPATIQERMPARVRFTVPDLGPGVVVIEIVLADGTLLTRADGTNLTAEIEGAGYTSQQSTKGRRS